MVRDFCLSWVGGWQDGGAGCPGEPAAGGLWGGGGGSPETDAQLLGFRDGREKRGRAFCFLPGHSSPSPNRCPALPLARVKQGLQAEENEGRVAVSSL